MAENEASMLRDFGDFITTVGFPVFVGVFVLWRLEPILAKILTSLAAIKTILKVDEEK